MADHWEMVAHFAEVNAGGPVTRRVVNTAISIVECPLDLAASPTALLAQINTLGHQAWVARSPDLGVTPKPAGSRAGRPPSTCQHREPSALPSVYLSVLLAPGAAR
ncbi:MAG: hypothetical protein ACRDTA_02470 [Pseudonocardiaceae bacterium]